MQQSAAVLVIGAGLLQCALIREAQGLGLYVIATDANPQAPGFAIADEHYVLSTVDVPGHAQLAQTLKDTHPCQLRGCVTAGADCAPSVSAAAEAAGLPGLDLATAQKTHDKAAVRAALDAAGLTRYQPRWLLTEASDFGGFQRLGGYPIVVKPTRERASRGVTLVRHQDELPAALAKAAQYGPVILVEEALQGTEHSAEMILDGSETVYQRGRTWLNIVDRIFSYDNGLAIELGHVNPTCLDAAMQEQILCLLLGAAKALGVTWGPWKADIMVTPEGPKILELTARLSGGFDAMGTSPLTGRHPLRQLLQLACSLPVDVSGPAHGWAACAAILPPVTGRVTALAPVGRAWKLPWHTDATIEDIYWMIQPGDILVPPAHNAQRSGFVLAHADEYPDAWQRATHAADVLAAWVEVEA